MRILITLVGEQTIPNVIFIREHPDVDRRQFISTREMERQNKSRAIALAAGVGDAEDVILVDDDSMTDIQVRLERCGFDPDDHFVVNLTGGTKLMSIGAYAFFSGRRSDMYYLPGGRNLVRRVHPPAGAGAGEEIAITSRLSVGEYLTAHDIRIVHQRASSDFLMKDVEWLDGHFHASAEGRYLRHAGALYELRERSRKPWVHIHNVDGLPEYLHEIRFPVRNDELSRDQVQFLIGGWFEEWIFHLFRQRLGLSPADLVPGITIRRNKAENEFDVMLTIDNRLVVIECKTWVHANDFRLLRDAMYKLAALKRDYGLFVTAMICTLSDFSEMTAEKRQEIEDRSRALNVNVYDRSALLDPAIIIDYIRGRQAC